MRRQPGPFEVKLSQSRHRSEPELDQETVAAFDLAAGYSQSAGDAASRPLSAWKRAELMRARLRVLPRGDGSDEQSAKAPYRNFDCDNYERCLGLAAALDWSSFTCKHCTGEVNQQLLWRAHHCLKKDLGLARLCDLPALSDDEAAIEPQLEVANFPSRKLDKLP